MGWRFSPHLLASRILLPITPLLLEGLPGSRLFNYEKEALILISEPLTSGVGESRHIKDSTASMPRTSVLTKTLVNPPGWLPGSNLSFVATHRAFRVLFLKLPGHLISYLYQHPLRASARTAITITMATPIHTDLYSLNHQGTGPTPFMVLENNGDSLSGDMEDPADTRT